MLHFKLAITYVICYNVSMRKYFIYCRKSTEDEDRQILSIDAQLSELNAIARQNGVSVVTTFTESKSAKGPGVKSSMKCLAGLNRARPTPF